MAYKSRSFSYIKNDDWYMTPWGEVGFEREDIPDEIKQRLIADLEKERKEREEKHKDEILYFE